MKDWIFTFGCGQKHEGYYVRVTASSYEEARKKMVNIFGLEWAFQYSEEEWEAWKQRKPFWIPLEKELAVII